jgi:hypothetical protein
VLGLVQTARPALNSKAGADDLLTDDSADSRQSRALSDRFRDLIPKHRDVNEKLAELQDRVAWIKASLAVGYDDQGRILV